MCARGGSDTVFEVREGEGPVTVRATASNELVAFLAGPPGGKCALG